MTIDSLRNPFIGYLVAKGIQITMEELFPPLREPERWEMKHGRTYVPGLARPPYGVKLPSRYESCPGLYCEKRKKIRLWYDLTFKWKTRSEFYVILGSTFPISTFLIIYHRQDPAFLKDPLIMKMLFYTIITLGIHMLQRGAYLLTKSCICPFLPVVIQNIVNRVLKVVEPAKVIFEGELEKSDGEPVIDFYIEPEGELSFGYHWEDRTRHPDWEPAW